MTEEPPEEPAAEPVAEGELVAPTYGLPAPRSPGQEAIYETVVPAAEAAQAELTATVNAGLSDLRGSIGDEQRSVDETARAQRRRVGGSFTRARTRIQEAIRSAIEAVNDAGLDSEESLDLWHEYARPRAETLVADKQKDTRDLGEEKGDEAVRLAERKAGDARNQIQGFAGQARERGGRRIANPGGGSDKAREARRRAAREVTRDTASKITENLAETITQIEGIGPEVRPQFVEQANELAGRLADQLPGIVAQVDDTRINAISNVATTVANNNASLAELGTTFLGDLDSLESSVLSSLRTATRASKVALSTAGEAAVQATRVQHDAVAQAGADLIATVLENVSDPRIRREAALRLGERIGGDLRGGFATAQGAAQLALAQVATTFAEAAARARQTLEDTGQEGARQAGPLAARAEEAAQQQAGELVGQMSQMLIDALTDGNDVLTRAEEQLDGRIDGFREGFDEAMRELARELDGKVREAAQNAREPLDTLDARLAEAMDKAQRKVEQGWLRRQLSSINWGFLAGLLVGILVTIAVIALLGTGIGALILAGALAGALSVAASTLTEDLIAGRPTDWRELGRQMVIGAVVGAAGGAVSGGAGAVLARQTAMSLGRRVATQTGVDFASSIGLGVGQNLYEGNDWDEGLLLNIATTGAMARGPAARGVQNLTTRARARAVDRGTAFNVTAAEFTQSQARLAERAGVDLPDTGAAPPPGDAEPAAASAGAEPGTPPPGAEPGAPRPTAEPAAPAPGGPEGARPPAPEGAPPPPGAEPTVPRGPEAPDAAAGGGRTDVEGRPAGGADGGPPPRRPSDGAGEPPGGRANDHQREAARQFRTEADRLEAWARDAGIGDTIEPARPPSTRPGNRRGRRLTPDQARAEARDLRRQAGEFEAGRANPLEDLSPDLIAEGVGALEHSMDPTAPAKRDAGRTVLGHYREYVDMSNALAARRYEIPGAAWDQMTPQQRWAANERFLERTVTRGDEIQLSTRYDRVNPDPSNYFQREIAYLEARGYRVSADGWQMLPPSAVPEGAAAPVSQRTRERAFADLQRSVETAGEARARVEQRNLQMQERLESRFTEAHGNRQRHVDQVEARLIDHAQERFRRTGDEARLTRDLQDIQRRSDAAREGNDTWLRERLDWVDDLTQQRHRQADDRFDQRVEQAERRHREAIGAPGARPEPSGGSPPPAPESPPTPSAGPESLPTSSNASEAAAPPSAGPEVAPNPPHAPEGSTRPAEAGTAAAPGGENVRRPAVGPEALWRPPGELHIEEGRPLLPAPTGTAHIGQPSEEELEQGYSEGVAGLLYPELAEAETAGQEAAREHTAPSPQPLSPGIDFDVGEHFPAEDDALASELEPVQPAADGHASAATSRAPAGHEALERWRLQVQRAQAQRQARAVRTGRR